MNTIRGTDVICPTENISIMRMTQQAHTALLAHTHDFIELVYTSEGSGVQRVDGRDYAVSRGSLLFLNMGQSHECSSEEGMVYYNFILKPEFMSETLLNTVDAFSLLALSAYADFQSSITDPPAMVQFTGRELLELDDIAARMEREFVRKEPGYRTVLYGYMSVVFAKIFRKMALPDQFAESDLDPGHAIAPEILSYIEEHCFEKITLSELAAKCFYNPSYFSRIFREYSGQSLTEYIHKRRIERAVSLLTETRTPIEEIGSLVGYSDKKQFYRHFRQYTGTTPGAIRK